MVERRSDPYEHRIKRVFLTPKARKIEADFFNIVKKWHRVIGDGIAPEHLDIIRTGMDQMIRNAEAYLGLEPT
jgi:DNA-binding MarR family transcriptional regulator